MAAKAAIPVVGLMFLGAGPATAPARPDVTIATFDGDDYAGWTTTGTAFGTRPARGTLAHQQPVDGYVGRGLVNTYLGGDGPVGTLTSPPFTIERDHVNFLVGGGNHPGQTCVDLLVDDTVVRTTPGNDSEHLDPATWDVRDLAGKTARVRIVDNVTGQWGHINVDEIAQSDRAAELETNDAPVYAERHRPVFHFTPARGWMNDPNGLVYADGEWHLFFQHNPDQITQGPNMAWGHAVSPDLTHWTQLPVALAPDEHGFIWSGSAVVDQVNTSGFGTADKPPLVAMYTAAKAPFAQHIAYSTDRGRTWTKYAGNPVIPHLANDNRDPHLIWYEPTRRWVVVIFRDVNHEFALFDSPDLTHWSHLQDFRVPGCEECPDFFPLVVDGDAKQAKWVFTAANGRYVVGSFDGKAFKPEQGPRQVDFGRNYYAVQTWADAPDGRRVQIAWMRGGRYPHMPFNQQMSVPAELTLRSTPDGPRLFRWPVRELDALHGAEHQWSNLTITPGTDTPLPDLAADAVDLRVDLVPGAAKTVGLEINGTRIIYSVPDQKLSALGTATVPLADGHLRLRVLVDRTSIETFAADGGVTFTSCYLPVAATPGVRLFADGGAATATVTAYEMRSALPAAK